MSLEELTKNFKPVKNEDTSIFKEYYPSFFKARKYPRFYQSLMEMSQYVNVPTYFWKEINNCLVVLHKRWIHQPVMYLALPPISKNGRIEDELKVIQTFKDFCVTTKLSEEDINLYDFDIKEMIVDKNNCEYIYLANEHLLALQGKKWKTSRNYINRFYDMVEKGVFTVSFTNNPSLTNFRECEKLYKDWLIKKNLKKVHSAHKVMLPNWEGKDIVLTSIYEKNRLIVWGVSEKIDNGKVIQTSGFRSYSNNINDLSVIIHHIECKYWAKREQTETFSNLGIGYFNDLINHKEKLHPCFKLQIYKLPVERNISHEEWKMSCLMKKKKGFLI